MTMRRNIDTMLNNIGFIPEVQSDRQDVREALINIVSAAAVEKIVDVWKNFDMGAYKVYDETPYEVVVEDVLEVVILEIENM